MRKDMFKFPVVCEFRNKRLHSDGRHDRPNGCPIINGNEINITTGVNTEEEKIAKRAVASLCSNRSSICTVSLHAPMICAALVICAALAIFLAGCGIHEGRSLVTYQTESTGKVSGGFGDTGHVSDESTRESADQVGEDEAGGSGGTEEAAGSGRGSTGDVSEDEPLRNPLDIDSESENGNTLYVFVCGAVRQEGVYSFHEGARVCDAVSEAGGYAEDADTSYVNQAALIQDEQQLWIPTKEEAAALRGNVADPESGAVLDENRIGGGTASGSADHFDKGSETGKGTESDQAGAKSASSSERVDINTADSEKLQQIPGIGEVKAQRIIEYREEHGPFGSAEEITNVSGIGEASFQKMKDFISVG